MSPKLLEILTVLSNNFNGLDNILETKEGHHVEGSRVLYKIAMAFKDLRDLVAQELEEKGD